MRGLIHIYTGSGKGKTTSAVGMSVRAKSRKMKVLFVQFMKEGAGGETELLKKLSVKVLRFEKVFSPYFHPKADRKTLKKEAEAALEKIKKLMGRFDLVVLDEFNCLVSEGLITEKRAMDFIKGKPLSVELVLTGGGAGGASKGMLDLADYVTEMKAVKHPYSKGVKARKGIEY